jgi:chromate transporter
LFIAVIGPLVPRLRRSPVFGAFLDGVNVGALALMVVVTWHLGKAAIIDVTTGALAILSLIALIRFKINTSWLILAGGILGLLAARGLG